MSNHKLSEVSKIDILIASVDASAGETGATYLDTSLFRDFRAVGTAIALADAGTMSVEFRQATDASGTGDKILGAAVVTTNSTGGAADTEAEVNAEAGDLDYDNGFTFIGVRIIASAAADSAGLIQSGNARFMPV